MVPGLSASWQMPGVVTERREIKSAKNAAWVGYVLKIATMGATFDVTVTPELYNSVAPGEQVEATGHFEDQKGILRLICDRLKRAPAKAAV